MEHLQNQSISTVSDPDKYWWLITWSFVGGSLVIPKLRSVEDTVWGQQCVWLWPQCWQKRTKTKWKTRTRALDEGCLETILSQQTVRSYNDRSLSTKQVGPMVRTSQCLESLCTTEPAAKVLTMSIKQIQEWTSLAFNTKSPFNS
jgi:hypothetical protein